MPNSKSFIYQSAVELARENLITQEEARLTLKEIMNWPFIDPMNPMGNFAGRNASPEQLAIANQQVPPEMMQAQGQPAPMMPQGAQAGDPVEQFLLAAQQLPPEVLQQILGQVMGGSQPMGGMPL